MEASTLDFIVVTPSLKNHVIEHGIVDLCVEKIRHIPQFEKLQRNMDLVLYLCDIIENLVFENDIKSKYKKKGYKLDIALTVFEKLGWVKPEDKDFLVNAINFLHTSGRIRKIPFFRRLLAFGKKLFLMSNQK